MALVNYSNDVPVLVLFNIDPDWSTLEQEEVIKTTFQLNESISSEGHQTVLVPINSPDLDLVLGYYDPSKYIVFNWCEGVPGIEHSEPLVARYLEEHGFTFTGAGSSAIELAQDKCRTKRVFDKAEISTPRWQMCSRPSYLKWNRFPAIVKLAREHCSEGIDRNSVVTTEEELKNQVRKVINKYNQPALVEEFIDGRELHVTLVGNGDLDILPPAEMEFSMFTDEHDRLCTFDSKFIPQSEGYCNIQTILPAPLEKDERNRIQRDCIAAYRAIGCRDYARIDLRIRDGEVFILDVNPNPDISPDTSTILAAELAGYSYGAFGNRIINLAAERHPALMEQAMDEVEYPAGASLTETDIV